MDNYVIICKTFYLEKQSISNEVLITKLQHITNY